MTALRTRARARVTGTVQGVGFRPFVYRLARELGLAGHVLNDAHGVLVEVEGAEAEVDAFLSRLAPEAPPLALVESVEVSPLTPAGGASFAIRESPGAGSGSGAGLGSGSGSAEEPDTPVTPDSATCLDCLGELFDPADRRYRYPFINCTNCGPRFTIVRGVPYDRPLTTMAGFPMCPACRAEYEDPEDRRFHAQPNACPACGPSLALLGSDGEPIAGPDPLAESVRCLAAGGIVAIKGIGGFHLACRADQERAVTTLRARKHREDKPFALMVGSLAEAGRLVCLGEAERALLGSPARPIVLAPRRADAGIAAAVAPGASELGLMLPYSPLHHLLLADLASALSTPASAPMASVAALVMTSGNLSDEPIAYDNHDARERLGRVADLLLVHDRPIETRTDDSVLRVVELAGRPRPLFVRRSRGYTPGSLPLPVSAGRPILACGAELKNTFCVAKGDRAWVSHHVGDLENYETLRSFTTGIEHLERLFAVRPELVAHDLHPEYLSTKYALDREDVELVPIQHHHAHLAACLAEHGLADRLAVGAIYDGSGYGTDATIWGGELLAGDAAGFERVGALYPVRLPGAERAIREPWRMACAWLTELEAEESEPPLPATLRGRVDPERWSQVARLAQSGLQAPATTSVGRLFDAVAALCGVRTVVNYEGQAAIELEAACAATAPGPGYAITVGEEAGSLVLDPRDALRALIADLARGRRGTAQVAAGFHAGLAVATVEACVRAASTAGTELVVLSGGVFLNRRLLEATAAGLAAAGLRVLVPERLPPGDGGIAYGQAVVAAARLARAGGWGRG